MSTATRCTHEVQVAILDLVRAGHALNAALRAVGIADATFHRVVRRDALLAFHLGLAREDGAPRRLEGPLPAPRARFGPRPHVCPDGGFCRHCDMVRRWAEGGFAHRRKPRRVRNEWEAEHDAALRELAGSLAIADIARRLTDRFGVARTRAAVALRARQLGIGLFPRPLPLAVVAGLFGVSAVAGLGTATRRGLLRPRRWGRWLVLDEAELEAFIRSCPWAYDPSRLDARHRLGRLGQLVHRSDPWLPVSEAARWVGVHKDTLREWSKRGWVRIESRCIGTAGGLDVVRRSELPRVAMLAERRRAERTERIKAEQLRWREERRALREAV